MQRLRRHFRAAGIGAGLIVLLWALWWFVAFVPFDRESHGLLIVAVTLAVFAIPLVLLRKRKLLDWRTGLYAIGFVGFLVFMYTVPIRGALPESAHRLNRQLALSHDKRYEYAQALFYEIARRYTGPTREYIRKPLRVFFIKDATFFWNARGSYVPSNIQAQVYRRLLISSGRFSPAEVEMRTGGCVNSPHGYVAILHPEREIYADLWAAQHFPEYRFGQRVLMPGCDALEPQTQGTPF